MTMDEFLVKLDLANLNSIFIQGDKEAYNEEELNRRIVSQMRKGPDSKAPIVKPEESKD
jgi:hypothetical protein